jgi:hypothetical protein
MPAMVLTKLIEWGWSARSIQVTVTATVLYFGAVSGSAPPSATWVRTVNVALSPVSGGATWSMMSAKLATAPGVPSCSKLRHSSILACPGEPLRPAV